jgi:GT2 family glycosyltransferase
MSGDAQPVAARRPAAPAADSVAICIVTHHDAADVPACFAALARLAHRPVEVVVADCASGDETLAVVEREGERLRGAGIPLRVLALPDNRGFTGGMNAAFAATAAPWLLTLNADALPASDYLERLLARAAAHPELAVGAVTGRLVRPAVDGVRRLDACGMRLTRTWRHLDRGSSQPDVGQYDVPERVFGGTGAATLFRRAALDDVAVDGEVFDPRFHTYREDAELAFRLRERGWEVLYEPAALAEHRRRVLPERRAALPAAANYHGLKNRYLLRLYHQTAGNFLRTLPPAAFRDLAALAYVLAAERSSLPAYAWLWRHRRELLARRRAIQRRRTVPPAAIDRWFRVQGLPL